MKINRFLLILPTLFTSIFGLNTSVSSVYASDELNAIDLTSPMDDLLTDDYFVNRLQNGEFKGSSGDCELINFYEYNFDTKFSNDYGIYLYVFNPNVNKTLDNSKNMIEIGIRNKDDLLVGSYNKYKLSLVSKQSGGLYDNKFFKFKVNCDYSSIYDKLSVDKRIYEVSGIEIKYIDSNNAKDYDVSSKFQFTGFGKGCNNQSESNLSCKKIGSDSIHLNVNLGYLRSGYVNEFVTQKKDLQYAYFGIPNSFFNNFGNLTKISYNAYEYSFRLPFYIWDKTKNDLPHNIDDISHRFGFINAKKDENHTHLAEVIAEPYCFTYGYDGTEEDWKRISNTKQYGNDYVNAFKSVSRFILVDSIESEIPQYQVEDICKNHIDMDSCCDIRDISKTIDSSQITEVIGSEPISQVDGMTQIMNRLFGGETGVGRVSQGGIYWNDLKAITKVDKLEEIGYMDNYTYGSNYFINSFDVPLFNTYYNSCIEKDQTMILFRFNTSDYWTAPISESYVRALGNPMADSQYRGYSCFPTIIKDFDIISFTFKNEREETVIPVVSDPKDLYPGFNPPTYLTDTGNNNKPPLWVIILLSILGVILIFWLIKKILDIRHIHLENKANKQVVKESKIKLKREKKARKRKD